MARQRAALPAWRARLEALDPSSWAVEDRIDWHLVRAEMNGLDFDHRVRRPWERDPAFYVMIFPAESDVPAHEGAVIHGWIDLWTYDYPLSPGDAERLAERIEAIPPLLEQARGNLTGNARDLWPHAYLRFLEEEDIHAVKPWMDPALRDVSGSFTPAAPGEIRNFFSEVNYRDPLVMRTHMHHWIELARMREDPHPSPIRATPSLYNIFAARSEGLATGVEEWMMHAGLFDDSPRSRELVWIMVAQRAARALSGLMQLADEGERAALGAPRPRFLGGVTKA